MKKNSINIVGVRSTFQPDFFWVKASKKGRDLGHFSRLFWTHMDHKIAFINLSEVYKIVHKMQG